MGITSAIYGWGCNSCGCNLSLSKVRPGSFRVEFGPIWGPKGFKHAPNQPQTTPDGARTTSNCSRMSCSHIHRSPKTGYARDPGVPRTRYTRDPGIPGTRFGFQRRGAAAESKINPERSQSETKSSRKIQPRSRYRPLRASVTSKRAFSLSLHRQALRKIFSFQPLWRFFGVARLLV